MTARLPTHIRAPKRAAELALGDHVLVDDHSWTIASLAIEWAETTGLFPGRKRYVRAKPPNPAWPGPDLVAPIAAYVTILIDADAVRTPAPHAQRIAAHAPTKRGWYTDPGGYDVACACGWRDPEVVHTDRVGARDLWLVHKAQAITEMVAPRPGGYVPAAYLVPLPAAVTSWPIRYQLMRERRHA